MVPHLKHLVSVTQKLGIAFLLYTCSRLLFCFFNHQHFTEIPIPLFFYGLRFDAVAIAHLFAPLILLELIPFPFRNTKIYHLLLKVLFHIANAIGLILNLIDVAYFNFSFKRSTSDLLKYAADSADPSVLAPEFIKDYWYLFLFFFALMLLAEFLYRKTVRSREKYNYRKKDYLIHLLIFLLAGGGTTIGLRGGMQLRPLTIVSAGKFTKAELVPIVLNTPFTFIRTMFKESIPLVEYFGEEKLESVYSPKIHLQSTGTAKAKNVVVIILESFAREYVGSLNGSTGYTPFLDSLISKSLVFTNAKANGLRSIDALPAIFAGIPSITNTAYINSHYSSNKLNGIPKILNINGYNTSFYHGGANGTMGFDNFVKFVGIDDYYGMDEYPNYSEDYDKVWGIFDEPYLQYFANELDKKPAPFFSTVFTLSSHHPYSIPEKHKNKFSKGALEVHETIGYADYALKRFFETAKTKAWFSNTLFVLTADHSAQAATDRYKNLPGAFSIPILFFDPNGQLKGKNGQIAQQTDIGPSILHLLNSKDSLISFGSNLFDTTANKFTVNYANGIYMTHYDDYLLMFDGEKSINLYRYSKDSLLQHDLLLEPPSPHDSITQRIEEKTKAFIQQYHDRLIHNKLYFQDS